MLDPASLEAYLDRVPRIRSHIRFDKRPWTLNSERRMHRYERAAAAREWRTAFAVLARANRTPTFARAVVIVQPHRAKGPKQDADACHPAAKAAIDGLVDAGVLKSDGPDHVVEIRYLAAVPDSTDALSIFLCEHNHTEGEPNP